MKRNGFSWLPLEATLSIIDFRCSVTNEFLEIDKKTQDISNNVE
jgi:hypothetical protein